MPKRDKHEFQRRNHQKHEAQKKSRQGKQKAPTPQKSAFKKFTDVFVNFFKQDDSPHQST